MSQALTIGQVMTEFPYSIDIDAHANSAKTMLAQLKIHHLPVLENDIPVAVVTARDIHRAEAFGAEISAVGSTVKVRDVVEPQVYTVEPDEPLDKVLLYMAEHHIDVAVVLKHNKLAGILTVTDICRRYAELVRSLPAEQVEDLDREFRS